jgi:kumamolisin
LPQMAAQGQAVFVASGDSGAFDAGGDTLAVDEPGSQPYASDVGMGYFPPPLPGGTYLEQANPDSGGGVSAVFQIPSYQEAIVSRAAPAALVSMTMRNVPDVVVDANELSYYNGSWIGVGGTSLSAPVWASFISLVNQGLGEYGPIGFANPMLYQLAQSGSYASDFHDITMGNNGYYPAEPGFDDATGLGSFNGLNLYTMIWSE